MVGCFYYYEGYSMEEVIFFVWVFKFLGIECFIIFNVLGSVNLEIEVGDIVFVCDYINYMGDNLFCGYNDECLGLCFFDMFYIYDCMFNVQVLYYVNEYNIWVYEGVYLGLQGFNFEILVEY